MLYQSCVVYNTLSNTYNIFENDYHELLKHNDCKYGNFVIYDKIDDYAQVVLSSKMNTDNYQIIPLTSLFTNQDIGNLVDDDTLHEDNLKENKVNVLSTYSLIILIITGVLFVVVSYIEMLMYYDFRARILLSISNIGCMFLIFGVAILLLLKFVRNNKHD